MLDTSVVIDLDTIDVSILPAEVAVTALTVAAVGRKARGGRAVDLMIAAVACSVELPLSTRNPDDFTALDGLVEVVAV